jgi:exonuclease III
MVCLVSENKDNIKPRSDLMNPKFPSIWCEEVREFEKNILTCGFYREWSHNGHKTCAIQLEAIKVFCSQIEKASKENKNIIIQGDANLCAKQVAGI